MEHLENMLLNLLLGGPGVGFILFDPFVFVLLFGRFPFLIKKIIQKLLIWSS